MRKREPRKNAQAKDARHAHERAGKTPGKQLVSAPSKSRKWCFRLGAVLSPFVLLALLETALRVIGYGYPTAFFLSRKVNGQPFLIENDKFGWRFFGPALARSPRTMVLPDPKPPDTCRIFVLGESAAYGDPQPDFGLPRLLEVLLRERYPGVRFEVVNAAMTAINSHVILPIARDCARHNGDVWVIYMGNNEVVGPFGAGTVFGPQTPSLGVVRASLTLKALRLSQALGDILQRVAPRAQREQEWGGMTMFLQHRVRRDDPRMASVYSHFARNLADIVEVGRRHGVKVVVSTVASNLKDCAPFGSLHRPDLTSAQTSEWDGLYQAGVKADDAGNRVEACAFFQKAAQLDDQFADLQFRWARCLLALGKEDEARLHFALARDCDTLRFRADSQVAEIIRRTAGGREAQGILLADAQQQLAHQSPHGCIGNELLYEHVHPNFRGNYLLARSIADQIAKLLPNNVARNSPPARAWPSETECAALLGWSGWNHYEAAQSVMLRFNDPPFLSQLNHPEQYQVLRKEMEQLLPGLTPAALRQNAADCERVLKIHPEDWVIQKNLGRLQQKLGDISGAAEAWRTVVRLLPHSYEARLQFGLLLVRLGQNDEALRQFEETLRLKPDHVPALNGKGLALADLGLQPEAVREYELALSLSPDSSESHMNLGMALKALGKATEASEHFRRALDHKLNSAEAMVTLGKMCASEGWINEALTNFAAAIRLDPADADAHFCYAGISASAGRQEQAIAHFSEAVRLNPDFAEARLGLGIELGRQGRHVEANDQFARAVRLKPGLLEGRLNLGISLLKLQKPEEALSQFQEALRLQPGNQVARKYVQDLLNRTVR